MKIINCGCRRTIHLFPAYNGKCPFCGEEIKGESIDNSFLSPFEFVNKKLSEIDVDITLGEWAKALSLIDELMEWKPNFSELHWRKLLVSLKCKNNLEILKKGKVLENNPSFQNAIRYADDTHKSVYLLIKKAEDEIVKLLENELIVQEKKDKVSLGLSDKPEAYQKAIADIEIKMDKAIRALDSVEKQIREFIIDFNMSVSPYKQEISIRADKISNYKDVIELTNERKTDLVNNLTHHINSSKTELNKVQQEFDEKKPELEKLKKEQTALIQSINDYIKRISDAEVEIKNLLYYTDIVTQEYADALNRLHNGYYSLAKAKIKHRFDEIFSEVIKTVKI